MRTVCILLFSLTLSCAWAQQQSAAPAAAPQPQASPPPGQLEPAVDTSATAKSDAEHAPPARDAGGKAAATPRAAAGARTPAVKGPDRLELETTDITGNRELPKVLYIVPWKRSDLGDLVGKPPNSLLDEVLQPIDRDVFLRENRYYDALKPDAAGHNPGAVQGSSDKP